MTPLMCYAEHGPVEHALMLLEHGADIEMGNFAVGWVEWVGWLGLPFRSMFFRIGLVLCGLITYAHARMYVCLYTGGECSLPRKRRGADGHGGGPVRVGGQVSAG